MAGSNPPQSRIDAVIDQLRQFMIIALESRDSWRKQDGSMIELGVPDDAEAFLPSISQGQINKLEAMYERLDKKLARAEGAAK